MADYKHDIMEKNKFTYLQIHNDYEILTFSTVLKKYESD